MGRVGVVSVYDLLPRAPDLISFHFSAGFLFTLCQLLQEITVSSGTTDPINNRDAGSLLFHLSL